MFCFHVLQPNLEGVRHIFETLQGVRDSRKIKKPWSIMYKIKTIALTSYEDTN